MSNQDPSARRLIALAPGFNPQQLPDLTPPVEGVRPWQYHLDTSIPEAERKAYHLSFNRGSGKAAYNPDYYRLRPATVAQVIESHLEQEVHIRFDGAPQVSAVLSGGGADPGVGAGYFPFTGPVAVIGTTPPSASAQQSVGHDLLAELASYLAGDGIGCWKVVAADPQRRWVERTLLVDYTAGFEVRQAASVHLQPFLTVWRPGDAGAGVLEVVDLRDGSDGPVVASGPARLGRLTARTCPILEQAQRGDLCVMHGGPWISASITAAANWESHRRQLIGTFGCDACGDGGITLWLNGHGVRQGTATIRVAPVSGRETRHDLMTGLEARRDRRDGH